MGAGQTRQKQLDQYGQLLSPQEKIAISASFQAIAGSTEVNFFQEEQLQVIPARLLDVEAVGHLFCPAKTAWIYLLPTVDLSVGYIY